MKNIYIILSIVLVTAFYSCSKDPIISNENQEGISKITHYPTITVNGDQIVALPLNGTFTDAGATAKAGSADIPVVVSGTVNTAAAGTYSISYIATNPDGFSVTGYRTVVVYSTAPDAAAHDLSGSYLRAVTGELAIWEKIAPGVYIITNPGGAAAGESLKVAAINPSGYTFSIPTQHASDGSLSESSGEVYTNSTPASYVMHFLNPTYGTQLRSFVKQ
jgi:hypothetical protein